MRYYYSKSGKPEGPVDAEVLDQLAAAGALAPTTPVLEEGSTSWSTYAALRPSSSAAAAASARPSVSAGAPQAQPSTDGVFARVVNAYEKLSNINEKIEASLSRLFRMPSFVPESDAERRVLLKKNSALTSLFMLLFLVLGFMVVSTGLPAKQFVIGLLSCFVSGFVLQYLIYQISRHTNAMLIGPRIKMSSIHFPRYLGTTAALAGLAMLFLIAGAVVDYENSTLLSVSVFLLILCPQIVIAIFCFNAEKTFVTVAPAEVTPGRDFNNCLRFILRVTAATLQLLAPWCMLLSLCLLIVSWLVVDISFYDISFVLITYSLPLAAPVAAWAILSVGSWILDPYDGICSLSGRSDRR